MSPLGTVFVHEGAERRMQWRQAVRVEVIAASVSAQVQHYPVLARFIAVDGVAHESDRKASIVVGTPSLGTTPRKIDLVRGFLIRSAAICLVSIY